ncbi:hypothetical protein FDECE_14294 [Fusarium decemcellulare]|nr:hypothetical protein FDECE_14294 [Fusarium decemcellulare]
MSGINQGPNADDLQVVIEDPAQSKKRKWSDDPSLPQTEEEWQDSRVKHGLDTAEHILNKIMRPELSQNRSQLQRPDWQKVVLIAASIVDLSVEREADAELALTEVHGRLPPYGTSRKDRAAVLRLILLFDSLYSRLEHRAFELLVILDIPLSKLRLWPLKKFQEIKSQLSQALEIKEEIQASLPFYIPFLVRLFRPQYTLDQIYRALNTNTLSQRDFERFQETHRSRQFRTCLLNTLGDYRTRHRGFDSSKILHADDLANAITHTSIAGFKTFDFSAELQLEASRAGNEQTICTHIAKHGSRLVQFDWSDTFHLPVADQAIDDLVSYHTHGITKGANIRVIE